jgi:hypothetical protein
MQRKNLVEIESTRKVLVPFWMYDVFMKSFSEILKLKIQRPYSKVIDKAVISVLRYS